VSTQILQAIEYDAYVAFWAEFSAASSAPPSGPFDVTCSCDSYGENPDYAYQCAVEMSPVEVGPPALTPSISGVSPSPWIAGETIPDLQVQGSNLLGSVAVTITWQDGTSSYPTCTGAPDGSTCDAYNVAVPANEVGQAMVGVSTSSSGESLFDGTTGGELGSDGLPVPVVAVTLSATWNGSPVSQGSTVWITPAPALSLVASLVPTAGGSLPSGLNITWAFQSTYTGPDGIAYSSFWEAPQPANNSWNVNQALGPGSAPGGSALLSASYQGNASTIAFTILGQNPSPSAIQSALGTNPWFIQGIAQQESADQQFSSAGYPYWTNNSGYGIMQLDPPRSVADMWVWTTNVQDGVNEVNSIQGNAVITWQNQVNAWNAYNVQHSSNPVPMQPNISTGNCTFSYTPSAGQHLFSDAIWIKFYNTGPYSQYPYLVFQNGQWVVQDGQNYVQYVCSKIP